MAEIQKQITTRIGPHDYEVVLENATGWDGRGSDGRINHRTLKVHLLVECLEAACVFETAWHEHFHGVLELAGFGDHSEQMVQALGAGIVQVLRDNPWMGSLEAFKEHLGLEDEGHPRGGARTGADDE